MNPDYFDDDDLINDYVQQEEDVGCDDDEGGDNGDSDGKGRFWQEDEGDEPIPYDSDDEMQADFFGISVGELLRKRATHVPDIEDDYDNNDDQTESPIASNNNKRRKTGEEKTNQSQTNHRSVTEPTTTTTTPMTTAIAHKNSNANVTVATTANISRSLRLPNKGDNLYYNFERYDGAQQEWGSKASSRNDDDDDGHHVTSSSWKLRNNIIMSSLLKTACATTSAGAKVVEYLERRRARRQTLFMSTRSDGVRQIPREGEESVPMTVGNGTRVHVCTSKPPTVITEQLVGNQQQQRRHILGLPMSELMRRSEAMKKSIILLSQTCGINDEEEPSSLSSTTHGDKVNNSNLNNYLWVDKHAPTCFSHLLSDESINREVLRALRAWDPYVFQRQPPRQRQFGINNNNNNSINQDEVKKKSNDLRPDECNRVILLSGPPGVGKTTLAHILAKHAGYRPMEVNASDERSAAVLKERVVQAMESTTLNFSTSATGGRPNCLILDEIDGADAKGAISALVEIIRAEIPSKSTTKASKHKKPFLRRPMIFICNHKYAPALRPLLPYCRQFDVTPPSSVRLVARLRAILAAEHVTVGGSSNMLNQLVVSSGGDIRSCLYTLQFASARAKGTTSFSGHFFEADAVCMDIAPALASAMGGSGVKDERNDVSSVITSVFREVKEKKNGWNKSKATTKASVDRVMDLVKSFDDQTKTLDGMFMNVMRVSYIDPTLDRCAAAHEWMSGADLSRRTDGGGMQSWHIPASAAAIHLLCRVETRPNLTFSTREMSDLYYQHETNVGLTQRFLEGSSTKARANMRMECLASETIPYALWMLSAGQGSSSLNRPASSIERLSPSELQAFHSHVSTLLSLGLKYVAADNAAVASLASRMPTSAVLSAVQLCLEPPIDMLVKFSDLMVTSDQQRNQIPASLKELLAQHAVQEGMRIGASARTSEKETIAPITQPPPPLPTTVPLDESKGESERPLEKDPTFPVKTTGHKSKSVSSTRLEPAAKRVKSLNFLGEGAAKVKAARTAKRKALVGFLDRGDLKNKLSNTGSGIPLPQVVRFKYQKGFTQAVRTPCRWDDLVG